ncbi:MAG: nitrilase-related carbon-nitrogen hydrolase [Geodermatophilaceae bacterium]|jgi:predicted amidohydrolase
MRITLAQLAPTLGDVATNLARAEQVLSDVADDVDLVVFPELFLTGYSIGTVEDDVSIYPDDSRLRRMARAAGEAGVLMGFVEAERRGLFTYNSAAYYQDGALVHVHRKLYLPTYSIFEERKHFTPGPSLQAFQTPQGHRAAILICNDAWQPQLAFLATQDGAHILYVPTASAQSTFPEHYDSHTYWMDITRFYARMFQVYVVFVNRVGSEGELHFWGGSHVVDPWGELVAQAKQDTEEVLTVDIDMAQVARRRRAIPLVKEARLGLIRREVDRLLREDGDL